MRAGRKDAAGQHCALFVTEVRRSVLPAAQALNAQLEAIAYSLAEEDEAGQAWCTAHAYPGYTSYGSINDLAWRFPPFALLKKLFSKEAKAFAALLEWDLGKRALRLDSMWVNVLGPGGGHSGHIHPNSVLSGTYYVRVPEGASALRLEDPRLPLMMAAPPRLGNCQPARQGFIYLQPQAGEVIMWESWLRHEVPMGDCEEDRISISFNIAWN